MTYFLFHLFSTLSIGVVVFLEHVTEEGQLTITVTAADNATTTPPPISVKVCINAWSFFPSYFLALTVYIRLLSSGNTSKRDL